MYEIHKSWQVVSKFVNLTEVLSTKHEHGDSSPAMYVCRYIRTRVPCLRAFEWHRRLPVSGTMTLDFKI
jgi:hypothetical protein